jgi:hypothetical protein
VQWVIIRMKQENHNVKNVLLDHIANLTELKLQLLVLMECSVPKLQFTQSHVPSAKDLTEIKLLASHAFKENIVGLKSSEESFQVKEEIVHQDIFATQAPTHQSPSQILVESQHHQLNFKHIMDQY